MQTFSSVSILNPNKSSASILNGNLSQKKNTYTHTAREIIDRKVMK